MNHTWAYFRTEFTRDQPKHRIISSTTSGSGYHTSNIAEYFVHGKFPPCQSSDGDVDTATAAYHETVAALTNTIATLSEQLAVRDVFTKSKDAGINSLTQ
jgi:hypothetical protein